MNQNTFTVHRKGFESKTVKTCNDALGAARSLYADLRGSLDVYWKVEGNKTTVTKRRTGEEITVEHISQISLALIK